MVKVKFKWPSLPPGLSVPSRLGTGNGARAHSLSVYLSVLYLADPIPAKSIFRGAADRRRDGRRGALTADDSTRANLEQVVTVTIAQCDSLSIEKPNILKTIS